MINTIFCLVLFDGGIGESIFSSLEIFLWEFDIGNEEFRKSSIEFGTLEEREQRPITFLTRAKTIQNIVHYCVSTQKKNTLEYYFLR